MVRVSIVIPTLNSGRTLRMCLESVSRQTCGDFEAIVVDSNSNDDTGAIARDLSAKLILRDSGMTEARLIGCRAATGDYILNLDSDQSLAPRCLELALETRAPVVALGEVSVGGGIWAGLNRAEKRQTQLRWTSNIDVATGLVRPRFFARELLLESLESIPRELISLRPSPYAEDTLIFLNTPINSGEIAFVPEMIVHREEESFGRYVKKWYRNGIAASHYIGTGYEGLVADRVTARMRTRSGPAIAIASLVRGLPFLIGYRRGISRGERKKSLTLT